MNLLTLSACVVVASLLLAVLSARGAQADHAYGYTSIHMYSDIVITAVLVLFALSWASIHWEVF